jgi:cell division protein FtsL
MATASISIPRPRAKTRRARSEAVTGQASFTAFYTVKRVDNSRLRREVNPEHRRECLLLLGLSILVFGFVFCFAWQHFQCVSTGYQIEQLKAQRAALVEWNHQLSVEQASLADPQRIDNLARYSGLVSPSPQQVFRVGLGGPAPVDTPEFAQSIPNLGPGTGAMPSGQ